MAASAKRDTIKAFLQKEISRLSTRKESLAKDLAKPDEAAAANESKRIAGLKSVSNFAWDQTKEFVKIYIDMGDQPVEASQVTFGEIEKRAFTLAFGNRKFQLSKLFADISLEGNHFKITKSKIIVYLKKAKEGNNWATIKASLDAHKKAMETEQEEMGAGDDPQAGMMKMMKKMYDEGDDDMKRTISKSWYEAQNKKTDGVDPLTSAMGGMGGGMGMPGMPGMGMMPGMGDMMGGMGDMMGGLSGLMGGLGGDKKKGGMGDFGL